MTITRHHPAKKLSVKTNRMLRKKIKAHWEAKAKDITNHGFHK